MAKPIISFDRLRDSEVDQRAENTMTKMADNTTLFANPQPPLTVLETGLADFRASMVDASLKNRQTIIIKNQKRSVLENILRELALYVAQVAKGDPAVILAAGYDHSKTPSPNGPCPKPVNFRVELDTVGTGRVKMRVKPERTAKMYRFEYRLHGDTGPWTETLSTRSSVVVEGLELLKLYDFRVIYLGHDPTLTYSDVISSYVI